MAKRNVFTFQYVSILMGIEPINPTLKEIYIPICFYFNIPASIDVFVNATIYIPICFYFNFDKLPPTLQKAVFTFQYVSILIGVLCCAPHFLSLFTFQYVSILIHRPNSRFFSTLFPHFLLTSQSLQIFYHISFINSTKEKQNHLFFMFVEFCRCTGIFTLSEGDSLKIVGTE